MRELLRELIDALQMARLDTCSLHCPSVWTGKTPPPHSEKCQAIGALIEKAEKALAAE